MQENNFTKIIITNKNSGEAFDAIKNFRGWWSEEIDGNTDVLNDTFFYHYQDIHLCKIKLTEKIPDTRLVYEILDNQFSFTNDKSEWTETKLIFEISSENDKTTVKFTHQGLTPEYECYNICNESWENYIGKSLFNLIEMGKGNPNPKETQGFNAEIVEKWQLK